MTKKFKWLLPIAGLFLIVLGFVVMLRPLSGIVTLALLFGIAMLTSGISEIASFCGQQKGSRSGMLLASGILSTLVGIWVVFRGGTYAVVLIMPYVFAGWIMFSGITRITDAATNKGENGKVKGWQLALGIWSTLMGFGLLFNPLFSIAMIPFIMAFTMISHGAGTIELFFRLKKAEGYEGNEENEGKVAEASVEVSEDKS